VAVAGAVLSGVAGAFLGLFAAAFGYREWAPIPPCNDVIVVPIAQCAMPTAPVWLLIVGAALGAISGGVLTRVGRSLIRRIWE
jgi:hypothetical protein